MRMITLIFTVIFITSIPLISQDRPDYEGGFPDGCTTITVGKTAMADGSVVTSHTCDSHRTRGWFDIMPKKEYPENSLVTMVRRTTYDSLAMPTYTYIPTGDIPQVTHTYGFINTAYPCMN